MKKYLLQGSLLLLSLFLLAPRAQAQTTQTEIQKVLDANGNSAAYMGYSVAISGNLAIVGAYGDYANNGSVDAGAAIIYEQDASGVWVEKQKLTAPDAASLDQFGQSVAISGNRVIIGAWGDDDNGANSGSAWIFELVGGIWQPMSKLLASDGAANDFFGFSVAISGDRVLVGAYGNDDNGSESGSAYIFELDNSGVWTQRLKLIESGGESSNRFGYSVALSGGRAMVGASRSNGLYGLAYIYEEVNGSWFEKAKLTPSDGTDTDYFGNSVAILADVAIAGAPFDGSGEFSGSAYIYERDNSGNWSEKTKLTEAIPGRGNQFGIAVGITDGELIVGGSGFAYTFNRDDGGNWTENVMLLPSDALGSINFGISVGIFEDKAVVGAYTANSSKGAAYFYQLDESDTEPPVIADIANISVGNDEGQCSASVAFSTTVSDNVDTDINPVYSLTDGSVISSPFIFPVGETQVNVDATDAAGNAAETKSFTVEVLNTAPVINSISATAEPVAVNTTVSASVEFTDNNLTSVSFDWGDGSADAGTIVGNMASASHTYSGAGVYVVTATLSDLCGASASQAYEYVVVYDPSGGFATGGGWIHSPEGAYTADPSLSGKASFGFVSKYKKGATVPEGTTEFQFKAGELSFVSSSYDWLVVAGNNAKFKGEGDLNDLGGYGFMLTATDDENGDRFRIKIWDSNGQVVYDNEMGADDQSNAMTTIGGGSIVVHDGKSKMNSMAANSVSEFGQEPDNYTFIYRAYPNPVTEQLYLNISSETAEELNVKVIDMTGRLVHQRRINVQTGANQVKMNTADWNVQQGKLILQLESPSEGVQHLRLLKL